MKILVTGGAGLIGFHAAKYFHEIGHDVEVMDCLIRNHILGHDQANVERQMHNANLLKDLGIIRHHLDVSKEESWKHFDGHDVVIHMAGQCGVPTSIADPKTDYEINTTGTFNALEYCRKYNAKLVFASTNKVYPIHHGFVRGVDNWYHAYEEFDKGVPENALVWDMEGARTPYGNSKYMADLLCQEWAHTYEVDTGVFRMSCIYGPNQMGFEEQGWATWFIIALATNTPITIFGDGAQVRDMLYVEDCVKAYEAYILSDVKSGVWNLGGGISNTLTLNEHLDFCESQMGKRVNITYEDWRPLDQKWYVSDISKIKKQLNWAPKINPRHGLEKVIEWVERNKNIFMGVN